MEFQLEPRDIVIPPKSHILREYDVIDNDTREIAAYACTIESIISSKWWQRKIDAGLSVGDLGCTALQQFDNCIILAIRGINEETNNNSTCQNLAMVDLKQYLLVNTKKCSQSKQLVAAVKFYIHKNNKVAWAVFEVQE